MSRTLLDEARHGAVSFGERSRSFTTGQNERRHEMRGTTMDTPWGPPQDAQELAEGIWRVSTAGHGGLKLSLGRWASLPHAVRDAMFHQTFAEEDCEEPIVRTLLGIGDDRDRAMAIRVAEHFERYAPALPYLRRKGEGHDHDHQG